MILPPTDTHYSLKTFNKSSENPQRRPLLADQPTRRCILSVVLRHRQQQQHRRMHIQGAADAATL